MNENLTPEELETFNTLYNKIIKSNKTDLTDETLQHFLFKKTEFNGYDTVQILAGRAGAFKPKYIKIIALNDKNEQVSVDILGVNVMGCPQLVNYAGSTMDSERGNSLFFDDFLGVDWMVFGSSIGQGLEFRLKSNETVRVYFMILGRATSPGLIGFSI